MYTCTTTELKRLRVKVTRNALRVFSRMPKKEKRKYKKKKEEKLCLGRK